MMQIGQREVRPGMVLSIVPTENTNPAWCKVRLRVLSANERFVRVLALNSGPQDGPFGGPKAGVEYDISRLRNWYVHSGGFGTWYRNHGGRNESQTTNP